MTNFFFFLKAKGFIKQKQKYIPKAGEGLKQEKVARGPVTTIVLLDQNNGAVNIATPEVTSSPIFVVFASLPYLSILSTNVCFAKVTPNLVPLYSFCTDFLSHVASWPVSLWFLD